MEGRNGTPDDLFLAHVWIAGTRGGQVAATVAAAVGRDAWTEVRMGARASVAGGPLHTGSPDAEVRDAISSLAKRQHRLRGASIMLPYGVHRRLDRRVAYFAVVREPLERVAAYWHRALGRADDPQRRVFERYNFDVATVLEAHADLALTNDQVRMLSGSERCTVDYQDLELAKWRVEHDFGFVLTTESLAETLPCCLEDVAIPGSEWQPAPRTVDLRLHKRDRDVLAEANQLDVALYHWVRDEYLPRRMRHHESLQALREKIQAAG